MSQLNHPKVFRSSWSTHIRMCSTSIIRGAVEDPLAYCRDAVLCELIVAFRHYFPLVGIWGDNFDVEKAGIRASRLHPEKRRNVFLVCGAPNADQLRKRVSPNQAKITFLSTSVTRRRAATFVKDLPLYRR